VRSILPVAVIVVLASCELVPPPARAAIKQEKERKPAAEFALKDSNGKTVKLSDFKGKVVLLNFWATWCGPCKIEIPWFIEFEQAYRDKGLVILGVAMDEEGWEAVKPYMDSKKINYRVVIGDDITAQRYGGVESLPTTFLIDREGRTAGVHVGLVSKKDYLNDITQLLGVPSNSKSATGSTAAAGAN
jgi:cytochrome c biogenesis protein CcmG/thiol:disulfide interchange protein DsbE